MNEQLQSGSGVERRAGIFMVDDHPIVRDGLARLISKKAENEMTICGQADNATDAMNMINEVRPDMVIIDIFLRGCDGISLTKDIRSRWCEMPILVLSMHDESLYAERALQAGAGGYIMKNAAPEELLLAIRKVLRGGVYLSESISANIMRKRYGGGGLSAPISALSDRELEVFRLLGQGCTTRQAADELFIGMKTVETHLSRIKTKLNLTSYNEVIVHAALWVNSKSS